MKRGAPVFILVGVTLLAALIILLFGGCAMTKSRIKGNDGVVVQGPKDGNNVSLAQERGEAVLPLPAGSTVTVTKFGAVAWEPAMNGRPEVRAQPAREVTEVKLSRDTEWRREETKLAADTGRIDTSVAVRRLEIQSAKTLLLASIGAAVLALLFVYIKYPTPALLCGSASVVFFLAWKLSDLPSWFWVIGAVAIAGGFALYRGYERREKDEREETVKNQESPTPKVVS